MFSLQVPSGKDSNLSPECDHDSSFGSMSARSSTADSASPLSEYRGLLSSHAALSTRTDSNSPVSDYQGLSRRSDSQVSVRHCCHSSSCRFIRFIRYLRE